MNSTIAESDARQAHTLSRLYGVGDSTNIVGRDKEARVLGRLWPNKRLTILYGRAGIGKTSLVQAGAANLIRLGDTELLPLGRLTQRAPSFSAPLFEHNPFTLALLSSWAPLEDPALLSRMTVSDFLQRRQRMTGASNTLAVIDQIEELFRGSEVVQGNRKRFLDSLAEALELYADLHILLVIREGQLPDLLSDGFLAPEGRVRLAGLEPTAATNWVQQSLADTNPLIASGVVEELASELVRQLLNAEVADSRGNKVALHEDSVHPAYLMELYSCLRSELESRTARITKADVRRLLDVDSWLTQFICSAAMDVSRYYDRDPVQLCSWLARTFASTDGLQAAVKDDHGITAGIPTPVLLSLEDNYVLRSRLQSGSRWFELQSPRLITPVKLSAEKISAFIRTAKTPSFADYLEDAATAFSRGEFQRAELQAQLALQSSDDADLPGQARAETLLGNIDYQTGDTAQARHHYRNSAKLHEIMQNQLAVGRMLAGIGRLYLRELDAPAAVKTLESALNRAPDDAVRIELARALAVSGEGRAAEALLETVLTARDERDVGEARLLRSEIRADLGDTDGALSDLERTSHAGTPAERATRALTLARLGRFPEADEQIKQALHLAYDSGPVLLRAAQIQVLRGHRRSASRLARKAIKARGTRLTQHQRQQAGELQKEQGG